MDAQTVHTLYFEYIFNFPNEKKINYKIEISKEKKKIICTNWRTDPTVFWSDLGFYQCENCPLDVLKNPKCPVAVNIQSLVEIFYNHKSIELVDVTVIAPQRIYKKRTTLQIGLQSLFGLLMAASGCPNLQFLSPMVLFHLPFADIEETLLRSASFYLLQQFFNKLDGKNFEFSLNGLKKHYENVEKVNQGILKRIRAIENMGEASQNAIVTLNIFAQMFSFQHQYDLNMLKYIFQYS